MLEAEDVYVGVVPVVDISHIDLQAPIHVAHDLGAVAEGQVDREIGVGEVALIDDWAIDAEVFFENNRTSTGSDLREHDLRALG